MKEKIYDDQISPLMIQIIEICKEHKISLIADFGLDDDLHCTSALLTDEYSPSDAQIRALHTLKRSDTFAMAETIETQPDGSKRITLQRISLTEQGWAGEAAGGDKAMKVVANKNIPGRLPLSSTIAFAVALDHWHAPGWAWGTVGTFMAFLWIGAIVQMCRQEEQDIFKVN